MTHEEDKEFEEASKNIKTLWLKKSMREQGINTKIISLYKLDEIRRALDNSQNVQNKYNPKFKELQDEYQKSMNKLNTEMQAEATEARAEVDKLILQIKTEQQGGEAQKSQEKAEILDVPHTENQGQDPEPEITD
jgi:dsDNA-specific endonuclease/ATPase MutS2